MLKKMVFLVLPRKKMVFHRKTNFSHVKRWFWSGLPQENHLFTREKFVFEAVQTKTIFLRAKSWFFYEKPSIYEAKPKKTSFQHPLPIL